VKGLSPPKAIISGKSVFEFGYRRDGKNLIVLDLKTREVLHTFERATAQTW